jgi:hypothetical protein
MAASSMNSVADWRSGRVPFYSTNNPSSALSDGERWQTRSRSDLWSVFSGEVVDGKQRVAILSETLDCLLIFTAVGFNEGVEGDFGAVPSFCHPYVVQRALGFGLQALG